MHCEWIYRYNHKSLLSDMCFQAFSFVYAFSTFKEEPSMIGYFDYSDKLNDVMIVCCIP